MSESMGLDAILSEETVETDVTETVETPIEVAPVETTGEVVEAAPPAVQEGDQRTKGLEAALLAERRKRQETEQELLQLRQQSPAKPAAPDPAEFQDNPQEYWRLVARHEARAELQQAIAQAQAAATQQTQAQKVNQMVLEGQAKYPDFDTSINSGLGPFLTPQLGQALAGCERGSDVSYWLAKHPADASRISQLQPMDMVRELTKLDVRMAGQSPEPRQQVPQTLTTSRDARGQFTAAQDGPTPLDAILSGRTG